MVNNNDINTKLLGGPKEEGENDEKLKTKVLHESKKLWRVAGPAIFTRFSTFGISMISQAFIGHIGSTELAAYSLVFTVLLRFANGILLGMASALETLCGQAYGAKQYHMLGIYLQRSWLVLLITSLFLLPVFLLTAPILKLLGQKDEIADVAGVISQWMIPVMFSFISSFTCQMYLQAQSKNMIIAYLAAAALAIHVFLSWLLTVKYNWGISGAMTSTVIAYWIPNVGQLLFVTRGGCPETWSGFSLLAFKDLWPVIKLSLSSGAMLCLELWYNSVLVLLTGNMKNAEVAIDALAICININGWEMMISLGFLAAASVRVSNELGRGSSKGAKFAIMVSVLTSLAIGIGLFVFFLFFRGRLAYIFTEDTKVAAAVDKLAPLLAFSILLNSVQPVLSGVAVGAGWQSIVAYVNIASYYLIGIPLGIVLGYVINFEVRGIWIGMLFGTAVQTIVLIIITWRTDWEKQVQKMENNDINTKLLGGTKEKYEKLKNKVLEESKKLWIVAGPAIFTRFSTFGITMISQAFIGHIGPAELAAYSLVFAVLLRFALGILLGMASALETLCGQAYGARQYHMLGIYLQRSWLVLFIASLFLLPIFLFTAPILKLLGQGDEIAEMAGVISLWTIPVLFSFILSFSCQMYLSAQSKNMIIAYLAAAALAIHVFLSWLFTVKYNWGISGAMTSTIIAFWIPNVGQLLFVTCGGCPETWRGLSFLAFKDLWHVIKLSLSSGAMLCLELWYSSVLVLLTGNMKNAEVAIDALSICININGWEMMISLGFLAASSVRVANELGRGSSKAAKFAIMVSVITSSGIGVVLFVFFLFFKGKVAYIFTEDKEVATAVHELSPLLAFSILLNSVQPVLSGVAVGAGWQSIVAYVNIASYYLIGIPLGIVLGYLINFQVTGIWIGMLIGTAVQTIVLVIVTWRTDWDKQVTLAQQRVSRWVTPEAKQANYNTQGV
ncbi:Multi antimicrobial extrusion protein [Macleaya cordata]|uniref:Protein DETOXIFICATION n=1 Tax=Macleaya cordata TaxID=56857 RepID=A0A200QTG9_MACCD|nr:Multi antimicrobial extrusion protein [Macleaya cordata]